MTSSVFAMFDVDKDIEKGGILLNYGDFRFRIARSGGSNQKYKKLLQARLKPYRHQIDNDTMDEAVSEQIIREVFAATVLLGWESKNENGEWEPWLDIKGEKVPYSPEAGAELLTELPEFFREIQSMSGKAANFRKFEEEEDLKN